MRQHYNQTISTVVLSILLLMNVEVLCAAEESIAPEAEVATQKQDAAAAQDGVQAEVNTQAEPAVNYFDIYEFQVDGNTKLTNVQIETAVYPHMGEKKIN